MSSDWPVCRISDVAEVVGGGTPSSKVEEYYGGDIPWITPKDLSSHREMYISAGGRNITGLGLSKSSAKMLPIDTVLLTSRAPIGYVAIAKTEVSTNQGFKSLILKEGNDPVFFYYLLKFNVPLFESRATGSTFKEISGQVLKDTELRIPDYEMQKAIGEKLRSLDKKIELNRQTNQTLEQIAQAIFKSWFVDFEHTRAKIIAKEQGANPATQELAAQAIICGAITLEQLAEVEQNLETTLQQAIDEKLNQHNQTNPTALNTQQLKATAALFPNELVESELGDVPEGWEVSGFKNIVKKNIDNRGKTPPTTESGVPLLEVKHLPEGSIKPDLNTTKYVDEETYATWFRAHLEPEDIIISTVGTIGRICMVPKGERMTIAQNLLGMRFDRNKVSPYFMYYQMSGFRFRHDVDAR